MSKTFKGGLESLMGGQPVKPKRERVETLRVKPKRKRYETGETVEELVEQKVSSIAKRGRPVTQTKEITKSSQEGTKENETRATFIVNEDLLEKLKAIAYWERSLIKDVINTALQDTVVKYEKKSGAVKPIPKK